MPFDAFLKLDGISGESQDDKHKDEIEIQSFSWGVTQSGSTASGGGGGAGKASFQDISFTSLAHKGSPDLFLHCATGEHIKEATVTLRKAGRSGLEFITIKMNDLLVSSYLPAGATDSADSVPSEEVNLNFSQIEFTYTPQNPDGSAGTPNSAGWNLAQNKKV